MILGNPFSTAVGFNGQLHEPIHSWQILGNGHRTYNTGLRRFHSPDSESPFGRGGINAYAYTGGDPINRLDPSGRSWGVLGAVLRAARLFQQPVRRRADIRRMTEANTRAPQVIRYGNGRRADAPAFDARFSPVTDSVAIIGKKAAPAAALGPRREFRSPLELHLYDTGALSRSGPRTLRGRAGVVAGTVSPDRIRTVPAGEIMPDIQLENISFQARGHRASAHQTIGVLEIAVAENPNWRKDIFVTSGRPNLSSLLRDIRQEYPNVTEAHLYGVHVNF
jgi:RHS repeat-associated protein